MRREIDTGFAQERNCWNIDRFAVDQHWSELDCEFGGVIGHGEIDPVFTPTAFEAARAFEVQKDISAAVSWAPDIYNLAEVQGNRMLVNTLTANKLIADVWFARADFAKDHPDICEGLVRGIFDAMSDLKQEANKQKAAELMAAGYALQPADALGMLGDAHSTNWGENYQFGAWILGLDSDFTWADIRSSQAVTLGAVTTTGEQKLHGRGMALCGRTHQDRIAAPVLCTHVRAMGEQSFHGAGVPFLCRHHESRVTTLLLRV